MFRWHRNGSFASCYPIGASNVHEMCAGLAYTYSISQLFMAQEPSSSNFLSIRRWFIPSSESSFRNKAVAPRGTEYLYRSLATIDVLANFSSTHFYWKCIRTNRDNHRGHHSRLLVEIARLSLLKLRQHPKELYWAEVGESGIVNRRSMSAAPT